MISDSLCSGLAGSEQLEILEALFKGKLQSTLKCEKCPHTSTRPEAFMVGFV